MDILGRRCLVVLLASLLPLLSSCAGYRLGPSNGMPAGSRSIEVRPFENRTFEPRLTAPVATSLRREVQRDGTYALETRAPADIILDGALVEYERDGLSYDPRDILTPRDFNIILSARVRAIERVSGRVLLDQEVRGRTSVRAGTDIHSAERQVIPLLADDLARNITSLIADGTW